MRRSRTLEAVAAIERRARARVIAATHEFARLESLRQQSQHSRADDLRIFTAKGAHSSFSCAVAAARDTYEVAIQGRIALHSSGADLSAEQAAEALPPWARLRIGLERRMARAKRRPAS